MARYINLDDVALKGIGVFDENLDLLIPLSDVRKALQTTPTADVVPKSEVEELEAECERQYEQAKADILANMADGGTSCHWCIDEHKAQAKAEVAREIFEEIERQLNDFNGSWADTVINTQYLIAELKKKYTGEKECPNCKYFVGCECFDGKTCDEYEEKKE